MAPRESNRFASRALLSSPPASLTWALRPERLAARASVFKIIASHQDKSIYGN